MKKSFFIAAVFSATLAFTATAVNAQAGDGWLSRYWDGCKPSCAWGGKQYNGQGQCKECDKSDNKMTTSDQNRSSCDGGNSYTCWDMSPWAVDANTAYGFAAAHNDNQCGTCWELTFKGTTQHAGNGDASILSGKKLTVMISNIGGDVQGNQLDFLVPGGGVGAFDAFSGQLNIQKSALGEQYGGLVSAGCQGNPTCLKNKCDNVFGGGGRKDWLKAGCYFYADWMGAIGNPQYNAKKVDCPAALVDRWKNAASGSPPSTPPGGNPPVTPTTYTLTVNRNPTAGGTATAGNTTNITAGTQVNITATAATGYTFNNWTITGSGTIAAPNNASTSVTVNGNVTVTANFTQTSCVLTVNHTPTEGGTTTPASSQTNISAGTDVNISATAASGYTFSGWTIVTNSSPTASTIANANSASTSVKVNGNVTVRANFTQIQTSHTLTVNRNPTEGGSVKVGNNDYSGPVSVNGGTATAISATAASGYTFTSWAVTAGSAQIDNLNSASTSVKLSGNATITANFTQNPTTPTPYTLTVNRLPDNGAGTVTVNSADYSAPVSVNGGTAVNISATPAASYQFISWTVTTGSASITNASSATTTITLSSNATITANFKSLIITTPIGDINITVQAEDYSDKNGANMQTGSDEGSSIVRIGYIENGYSTTYNVNTPQKSNGYIMQFKIATGNEQSSFTVSVNGANVGTVSTNNTGGWSSYVTVTLNSDAQFNVGNNIVVLNFQNPVNVDYFKLIGQSLVGSPGGGDGEPPTNVKYNAAKSRRAQVALHPTVRGFVASLPGGHGFTSYSVVDLQGREVRSGRLGGSDASLSVSGLKHSVVFLRLHGKGKTPLSLKVVTY